MTKILKLRALSGPLVFQNELPRSDTVWGALIWAMKELEGPSWDPGEFLSLYENKPAPLVVSSVFPGSYESNTKDPCSDDDPKSAPEALDETDEKRREIFFFPKPLISKKEDFKGQEEYKEFKERKKAKWISATDLACFLRTNILRRTFYDTKPHMTFREIPRVRVPRLGGESKIWHQQQVLLPWAWMAIKGEQEWVNKAVQALRLIGERGLGGGATYGAGTFWAEEARGEEPREREVLEMLNNKASDANAWLNLSLYRPRDDKDNREWNTIKSSPLSSYRVQYRRGRMDSSRVQGNVFKSPVLYIAEGSILPLLDTDTPGENPKVTPHQFEDFTVYAQGIGFPLYFALQQGGRNG